MTTKFGNWLTRWANRMPLGKDGTGLRLTGQQLDDLANLSAQQHEALVKRHDFIFAITSGKGHDCAANAKAGNLTCQALEAARELMEKYA